MGVIKMSWEDILKMQQMEMLFYTEAPNPVFLVTAEISDFVTRERNLRMVANSPTNAQRRIKGVLNNYFNFAVVSDELTKEEVHSMVENKLIDLGWDRKSNEKFERGMEGGYTITAVVM